MAAVLTLILDTSSLINIQRTVLSLHTSYVLLAMIRMETDDALREILMSTDAGHSDYSRTPVAPERLVALTGHQYYTLHPFLLERLPPAFFARRGSRVFFSNMGIIIDLPDFEVAAPAERELLRAKGIIRRFEELEENQLQDSSATRAS